MKRSRIPSKPVAPADFGLLAWLEGTRIALPLKGVECRFEVTGALACVELDQIYLQNTDRALDCTYTFPLPAGAAVYRCELHVNGRVIRAKVEEKNAARSLFQAQKAAGRRAALVESERENLFTLSLGNVQPEDVIVVRFAWFQVLDRHSASLRLLVPTCPGVRYIPGQPLLRASSGRGTADDTDQVPDASRITPPRIDAFHPDAAYFALAGRLSRAGVESATATSPTHRILVHESESRVTVELSGRGAVPDRDFVLTWREPKTVQLKPQAWRWSEGAETYALVELRAPERVEVADHFAQDFYFLADRSGSMAGAKWQRTCEALRAFVALLGPKDRVWITLFGSDYRDFAEAPAPAPQVLADRGFQGMEALGTAGGTELLPAALHVLKQVTRHSAGTHASVVLITDGEVGNDRAIIQAFRQAPAVRVHTFGIDTTVNDAFLKSLARQQRGGCWLQTPDDDIAGTIAALGSRLRRPVITDLHAAGSWNPARDRSPDLHADEVVTLTLRTDGTGPLELEGHWPDGTPHRINVNLEPAEGIAPKLLWVRERIVALLDADRQAEAIALARQHNLICEGTAFIAWDEAEQVAIAREEIVQPAMRAFAPRIGSLASLSRSVDACGDDIAFGDFCEGGSFISEVSPPVPGRIDAVRESLQRAGIPAASIDAYAGWAAEMSAKTDGRLNQLREAAELTSELRRALASSALRAAVEPKIQAACKTSATHFLKWASRTRVWFDRIVRIQQMLTGAEVPHDLIDALIEWVVIADRLDESRLEKLELFAESLDRVPFSAGAKARRWRALLELSAPSDSRAHAIAREWLPELAVTT